MFSDKNGGGAKCQCFSQSKQSNDKRQLGRWQEWNSFVDDVSQYELGRVPDSCTTIHRSSGTTNAGGRGKGLLIGTPKAWERLPIYWASRVISSLLGASEQYWMESFQRSSQGMKLKLERYSSAPLIVLIKKETFFFKCPSPSNIICLKRNCRIKLSISVQNVFNYVKSSISWLLLK